MRRAARVDANQADIVNALVDVGASVQSLSAVGVGVPDLLVGWRSQNFMLEIKNPNVPKRDQRLTEAQRNFHRVWRGSIHQVHTVEQALAVLGVIESASTAAPADAAQ